MTFIPLDGAPNNPILNLSDFTEGVIPINSKIVCKVTATGVDAAGDPDTIETTTSDVLVLTASTPPAPIITNLSLSSLVPGSDITATASVDYAGDLAADGWAVQWDWTIDGTPETPGDGEWRDLDELDMSSSLVDLGGDKYYASNPKRLTADGSYLTVDLGAAGSEFTIQNGTLDFGFWPVGGVNQTWTTAEHNGAGWWQTEVPYATLNETSNEDGTLPVGADIKPIVMAYTDDTLGEVVRHDLGVDGFGRSEIKDGVVAWTMDANYTTLHDVGDPNGTNQASAEIGERGNRVFKLEGVDYNPLDDTTFGVYPEEGGSSAVEDNKLVGFRLDRQDPKGLEIIEAIQAMVDLCNDYNGRLTDINCHLWTNGNNDFFYIVERWVNNPADRYATLLFRHWNTSVTSHDPYILFTFSSHPAFLSNPSNPSDRVLYATENLYHRYDPSNLGKLHIKSTATNSQNPVDAHGLWRISGHQRGLRFTGAAGGSCTTTLQNLTVMGSKRANAGSFAGCVTVDTRDKDYIFVVKDNVFTFCGTPFVTESDAQCTTFIEDNKFDNSIYNHLALKHKPDEENLPAEVPNTVRRNYFGDLAASSQLRLFGGVGSLIEENIFNKLRNSHGNACTIYQGAYPTTVVRNNVFYNTNRSMSISSVSDEFSEIYQASRPVGLTVYNNLIYTDRNYGNGNTQTQSSFSWLRDYNTRRWFHYDQDQRNQFFNNSFFVSKDPALYTNAVNQAKSDEKRTTMEMKDVSPLLNDNMDAPQQAPNSPRVGLYSLYRNFSSDGGILMLKEDSTGSGAVVDLTTEDAKNRLRSMENYSQFRPFTGMGTNADGQVATNFEYWKWDEKDDFGLDNVPSQVGVQWRFSSNGQPVTKEWLENNATEPSVFFDAIDLNTPAELPLGVFPESSKINYINDGTDYVVQDFRTDFTP